MRYVFVGVGESVPVQRTRSDSIEDGWLRPRELVYASSREHARRLPAVLDEIRRLEQAERVGALYRPHRHPGPSTDLAVFINRLFGGSET
jgi:hypothetical protein